jgi:hypothetical protein
VEALAMLGCSVITIGEFEWSGCKSVLCRDGK